MSVGWQARMRRSNQQFRDIVWPRIGDHLGGGELVPVETVTESPFATLLDTRAMIDAWQVFRSDMRAFAVRVQPDCDVNWKSWSVRCRLRNGGKTEYHRLVDSESCAASMLRPGIIIQAYVDRAEQLLEAAAIYTPDLQRMLVNGWHGRARPNRRDVGVEFYPVWWDEAEHHGIRVVRVR